MNLLQDLSPERLAVRGLTWDHAPAEWEALPGSGMRVYVPGQVDYFQDPAGFHNRDNAPFLWVNMSGDFVAQAYVRPNWETTWDAGALMVRFDSQHYAKLCFESTDLGTTAAVSVVTNGKSDDANGANLNTPDVWLQIFRAGDVFGMHYALDGQNWQMVRLFKLLLPPAIKVGLVAQCPAGPGVTIDFLNFSVEARTIKKLRAGV